MSTLSSPVSAVKQSFENLLTSLEKLKFFSKELCSDELSLINKGFMSLSAHVRAKCIDIISIRASPKTCLAGGFVGDLVLWHTGDGDPRVRERALACLLSWSNLSSSKEDALKQNRQMWIRSTLDVIYRATCRGLLDSEVTVRCTSLLLLVRLSITWPGHHLVDPPPLVGFASVPPSVTLTNSSTPVVDDAFPRICLRLQDPGQQVRQLAAQSLADLAKFVSGECLVQTLEKVILTDNQVLRSFTDAAVVVSDNPSQPSLPANILSAGSSGAVISGLEDGFYEIRCAMLASVEHMASLSASFALNSQDLLVDMLTDDIQEVRLAAICALEAVGDQVPLQTNQLAIISSAMAECSGRIRRRLHQLLARSRLASAPCILALLNGLLQNLQRYPQDRESVWRCASSIGRRHPTFVEACLSTLLHLHSYLAVSEPSREDPAYLTVLLLVLNAEPESPGMTARFPRHLSATKAYLRELMPHLLPANESPIVKKRRLDSESILNSEPGVSSLGKFMCQTVKQIVAILDTFCDDYRRVTSLEDPLSINRAPSSVPRKRKVPLNDQLALLRQLVYVDLRSTVRHLDRFGRFDTLHQWFKLLTDASCSLITMLSNSSRRSCVSSLHCLSPAPLIKVLRSALKLQYLFTGKTPEEQELICQLSDTVFHLVQFTNSEPPSNFILDCLHIIRTLLLSTVTDDATVSSKDAPPMLGLRLSQVQAHLLHPSTSHQSIGAMTDESDENKLVVPNRLKTRTEHTLAIPEVRFTAVLATVSIRVRAVILGLSLVAARNEVCVLFTRPDHPSPTGMYEWWPPSNSWHPLDKGSLFPDAVDKNCSNGKFTPRDEPAVELRAHLELTAGPWSDSGTVELGLGYRVHASALACAPLLKQSLSLPLTPRNHFAKVRLYPCASV